MQARSALQLIFAVALPGALGGCDAARTLRLLEESDDLTSPGGAGSGTGGRVGDPEGGVGLGGNLNDRARALIDDFRDCDERIIPTAGRDGYWYHFAEPSVFLVNVNYLPGMAPDESWGTQRCGIYLTGGCSSCTSAGVGFQLSTEAWDLSGYSGLRVWFESETALWAVIVTKEGTEVGYSEYVYLAPTGDQSDVRELSFGDILPGTGFQGLDNAREIQFTVGAEDRGSFGFGIHRIELYE